MKEWISVVLKLRILKIQKEVRLLTEIAKGCENIGIPIISMSFQGSALD